MIALTKDIIKNINQSILCWLATVDPDGQAIVSPKEIFSHHEDKVIIANIASPNSVKNIKTNDKVCFSFVDILVQKGYQLKDTARIISKDQEIFSVYESKLLEMTAGNFPFSTIIEISATSVKPIIAPKYLLYPNTTEQEQIESAMIAYNLSN